MDAYVEERERKAQLRFRYRTRAFVAARAAREHLGQTRGLRILDLGAANGQTLLELRALLPGGQYVGVEIAQAALDRAPNLPADTTLVRGDATHLPPCAAEQPYDLVCALALLEHLTQPAAAVREAARALKPGGVFVATCPNHVWDQVATRLGLLKVNDHVSAMNRQRMTSAASQAGLQIVSFERFMWCVTGLLPYMRIPVPVGAALLLDRAVAQLRLLNWTFVNQCLVARAPHAVAHWK
jgi:SAM-dependent methyltransferase